MYNCTAVLVEKQDKVLVIKFNNPKKKNCVNQTAYKEITRVLRTASGDETITTVVFTGVGDFFTAGNDLSQSTSAMTDVEAYIKETSNTFKQFVISFIECSKVLIALINGPAIGIGATIIGLCDIAWCAEKAYISTPFTKLGIVPEACSSYLFPLIMGRSKAMEMLLFSEKMDAKEAYHFGFVSKIFKISDLNTIIWPKIKELAELPPGSLNVTKKLVRLHERDSLYRALNSEAEELNKRFHSEEFVNAMIQFATRKRSPNSKL